MRRYLYLYLYLYLAIFSLNGWANRGVKYHTQTATELEDKVSVNQVLLKEYTELVKLFEQRAREAESQITDLTRSLPQLSRSVEARIRVQQSSSKAYKRLAQEFRDKARRAEISVINNKLMAESHRKKAARAINLQ